MFLTAENFLQWKNLETLLTAFNIRKSTCKGVIAIDKVQSLDNFGFDHLILCWQNYSIFRLLYCFSIFQAEGSLILLLSSYEELRDILQNALYVSLLTFWTQGNCFSQETWHDLFPISQK